MALRLDELRLARPDVEVARADWSEHCESAKLPPDLLSAGDHAAFHILVARLDGENVATAIAFDLGTDAASSTSARSSTPAAVGSAPH